MTTSTTTVTVHITIGGPTSITTVAHHKWTNSPLAVRRGDDAALLRTAWVDYFHAHGGHHCTASFSSSTSIARHHHRWMTAGGTAQTSTVDAAALQLGRRRVRHSSSAGGEGNGGGSGRAQCTTATSASASIEGHISGIVGRQGSLTSFSSTAANRRRQGGHRTASAAPGTCRRTGARTLLAVSGGR